MKKFTSILISILFAVVLLGTLVLGIGRKYVQPSTITNLAGKLLKPVAYEKHNNGLYYPDEWNAIRTVEYEIPNDYDLSGLDLGSLDLESLGLEDLDLSDFDLENLDIGEIITAVGQEYGYEIDEEFVAQVLSDPETANLIDEYTNEIIGYMTGASEELSLNSAKLEKVVNKSIDKYEEKTGQVIDRSGLNEAIEEGVKTAVPEITSGLDEVKEENAESLEAVKIVFEILSLKILLICIAICVVLAGIIFAINQNIFVTFRFISIPGIVDGVLLFIIGIIVTSLLPSFSKLFMSETGLPESFMNVILQLVNTILAGIKTTGFVTAIVSVILCVLGFTLYKKQPKESKKLA